MSKDYAARELLKHGPLTFREFVQITGWTVDTARHCLERLMDAAEVRHDRVSGIRRNLYWLAR